jgi:hypothetical protein
MKELKSTWPRCGWSIGTMWPDPRTVANVRPLYSITYPATCHDIIDQSDSTSLRATAARQKSIIDLCLHCLYSRVFCACVRTCSLSEDQGRQSSATGSASLLMDCLVEVIGTTESRSPLHAFRYCLCTRPIDHKQNHTRRRKEPEYPDADAAADDVLEVRQHRLGAVSEVEQVVPANGAPAPWLIRTSIRVDGRFHLGVVYVRLHEELGARISQVLRSVRRPGISFACCACAAPGCQLSHNNKKGTGECSINKRRRMYQAVGCRRLDFLVVAFGTVYVQVVDVAELVFGGCLGRVADRRVVVGVLAALGDERVRRVGDEGALPQEVVHRALLLLELQDPVPDLHAWCAARSVLVLVCMTHRLVDSADTYDDSREFHVGVLGGEDEGGDLGDVVAGVALADDEEVAALVLREPVHPLGQERVGVARRHIVADGLVHVRVHGVGETRAHGALQEQHVAHCAMYVCVSSSARVVGQ